ncbi:MAG: Uma2 family endonuclease [Gemmatimonadota bacterium]
MQIERSPDGERLLTIEEFERLSAGDGRSELVRGQLLREPPAGFGHGRLANRMAFLLTRFVEERGLGEVLAAETGFVLREDPPTVRAPDVAFVAAERIPDPAPRGFGRFAPDLVVEILSSTNTASEIQARVVDYLDAGTRLVWVLDPVSRSVAAYRRGGEMRLLREAEELEGGDVLPGFGVPVADFFVG